MPKGKSSNSQGVNLSCSSIELLSSLQQPLLFSKLCASFFPQSRDSVLTKFGDVACHHRLFGWRPGPIRLLLFFLSEPRLQTFRTCDFPVDLEGVVYVVVVDVQPDKGHHRVGIYRPCREIGQTVLLQFGLDSLQVNTGVDLLPPAFGRLDIHFPRLRANLLVIHSPCRPPSCLRFHSIPYMHFTIFVFDHSLLPFPNELTPLLALQEADLVDMTEPVRPLL